MCSTARCPGAKSPDRPPGRRKSIRPRRFDRPRRASKSIWPPRRPGPRVSTSHNKTNPRLTRKFMEFLKRPRSPVVQSRAHLRNSQNHSDFRLLPPPQFAVHAAPVRSRRANLPNLPRFYTNHLQLLDSWQGGTAGPAVIDERDSRKNRRAQRTRPTFTLKTKSQVDLVLSESSSQGSLREPGKSDLANRPGLGGGGERRPADALGRAGAAVVK
jgi:hypothetical protein